MPTEDSFAPTRYVAISLIALIITIIVIIILAAISISAVTNSIESANFAKFSSDISTLQEAVTNSYGTEYQKRMIQNGITNKAEIYAYLAGGEEVEAPVNLSEQGATKAYAITNANNLSGITGLPNYETSNFYITDTGTVYMSPGYTYKEKIYVTAEIEDYNSKAASGGTVTLTNSVGKNLIDYKIYGQSEQEPDPTPGSPKAVYGLGENGVIEVKSSGKNLFDENAVYSTIPCENGVFTGRADSFYAAKYYITNDLIGKTLTFSAYIRIENATAKNVRVAFNNSNGNSVNNINDFERSSITFIPTSESDYIYLTYSYGGTILVKDIQLEEGNATTSYEPYKETRTIIDMTGHEPLRKIGNVADYIDYKNGRIVRNVGKFVISNSACFNGEAEDRILLNNVEGKVERDSGIGLCPIWSYLNDRWEVDTAYLYVVNGIFYWYPNVTAFGANPGDDNLTIKTPALQIWLASQSTENKTVYYQLAEPDTTERITLPKIPTHIGTTVITASDENLSASNIEVEYYSGD